MMSVISGETISAIATAPGRSGVAVVRVSGGGAFDVAKRLTGRSFSSADAGRFFYVKFYDDASSEGRNLLDDGLVLVFAAPHSYTGEDVVEFQTHGGSVTPRRILEATFSAGARLARRGEFTERAFMNGRLDLDQAEAVINLIDARTDRGADEALNSLGGFKGKEFASIYDGLLHTGSTIEHMLDFSEDELPGDWDEQLHAATLEYHSQISGALAKAREGKVLRDGVLVVLAGRPNVGKSSLLNALLGEKRAIVNERAGTTRDSIEDFMEVDGWPIRIVDTAGLRETDDVIEAEGVQRSEEFMAKADVILYLDDLSSDAFAYDGNVSKMIHVVTKCDKEGIPEKAAALKNAPYARICTSSVTGDGMDDLKAELVKMFRRLAATTSETPGADVTTRQCELLQIAQGAIEKALEALKVPEYVIAANEYHNAADAIGKIIGKVYSDDLLDAVFSRFCVGK